MNKTILKLLERMNHSRLSTEYIIKWGSPVPVFGDLSRSKVATLGLNPSNREFVDVSGNELDGDKRRFHTLKSLSINKWAEANNKHLELISESCRKYFYRNPYDGWFKSLDSLISGTKFSYYGETTKACHLDLIPYATDCKWTDLTRKQHKFLMDLADDSLALLLRDSPVQVLILNGKTVVESLQSISGIVFDKREIQSWTLPRKKGSGVKGYSYKGTLTEISGIKLNRNVKVLGFNHNIQSSFGVTTEVKTSIRNWITRNAKEVGL